MDQIIPGLFQTSYSEFQESQDLDAVVVLNRQRPPQRHGLITIHWPIDDGPMPSDKKVRAISRWVAGLLNSGMRVAVQCAAGINRSGLIAGRTLIELGHPAQEAIELVRQARPGALTNRAFVDWLLQEQPPDKFAG
ncbi:MAG: dual specificity protein phosphatase family protein [Anaerolineales bacterium]